MNTTKTAAHTPEPWILVDGLRSNAVGFHRLAVRAGVNQNFPDGGRTVYQFVERKTGAKRGESPRWLGFDERDVADARRIVACVNACAGIPTQWLETGLNDVGGHLQKRLKYDQELAEQAMMQRDELAAALRNLNETVEQRLAEREYPSAKTLYAVTEALGSALAALAKLDAA